MTLNEAKEIIEFFEEKITPKLESVTIEKIVPVPAEEEHQHAYQQEFWRNRYDYSRVNSLEGENLTVGIFYYKDKELKITFSPLTEKWLENQNVHNLPAKYVKLLKSL